MSGLNFKNLLLSSTSPSKIHGLSPEMTEILDPESFKEADK
jgi:hypothetical protein